MKNICRHKITIIVISCGLLFLCSFLFFRFLGSCSIKPTDPKFSEQWGFYSKSSTNIDAINMWQTLKNVKLSDDVIVAIIDSGIDYSHEDLTYCAWKNENEIIDGVDNDNNGFIDDVYGWNFCNSTGISDIQENNTDIGAHGTACAGIVAAQHNNVGISGIVGDINIKLMSLKILDDISGQGEIENVIAAIKYADMMGAKVCNLSFSTKKYSAELKETIEKSNMLFVVSAGNHSPFALNIDKEYAFIYPACFESENIIVTASIGPSGEISDFSNFGIKMVDIAAPGENILTTAPGNKYIAFTGTSFSAPFITGVASILYYVSTEATAVEIKEMLLNTASISDSLEGKVGGNRVLNAYQAIQAATD